MPEPRVTVFTTEGCGWCRRAKDLLQREGVPFREVDLTWDVAALEALKQRTGRMTVPQIFVDDVLVGGFEDLARYIRDRGAEALRAETAT